MFGEVCAMTDSEVTVTIIGTVTGMVVVTVTVTVIVK